MPFRDLLKKKTSVDEKKATPLASPEKPRLPQASEFRFVRTDTLGEEVIKPPHYEGDEESDKEEQTRTQKSRPYLGQPRASSPAGQPEKKEKEHRRLSERLHLHRDKSTTSTNVPSDLPEIRDAYSGQGDSQAKEAEWEDRATKLVSKSPRSQGQDPKLNRDMSNLNLDGGSRSGSPSGRPRSISDAESDLNIQDAIRLHEDGRLEEATAMFQKLADNGNVLSQVLYGLSLRHGWGCEPDLEKAVKYLTSAASNSATIEAEALKNGIKKGGAAKGELVLAIFELGNCFRYGWGVKIDKAAARQYYETAANLGDTDAMNEAAWCYLEGFGGKKDKYKAAQLLRLAEKNGSKTLGNTWLTIFGDVNRIWKEKYNPK